ncbi:MAG: T9SS type A sorting domain-containing protein [Flavobacteriaceae bacterium]|nr:T9SS type A sorting domain-containing protein [Flavobacteriaceae bacterium]
MKKITFLLAIIGFSFLNVNAQHSVARDWNEQLLNAIRKDFARPTVHARNLFHTSLVMYDSWAVFDNQAETVFLGKNFQGYNCNFNGIANPADVEAARHEMMSYAMFRLLSHRFANSPNAFVTINAFKIQFTSYGYDRNFISTDYSGGSYAALGNYLAEQIIAFGNQDGSNEQNGYANEYYTPVNEPIILDLYEDNNLIDPNRWQPLAFDYFVDQSGNPFPQSTPAFLGPEWGQVKPFCLLPDDLQILNNGFNSYVYNNPGPPAYIQNSNNEDGFDDAYKWNFALVASWSAQLDPNDNTMIDISPGALGNVDMSSYPETLEEYKAFYDFTNGGDIGTGRPLNPKTNAPYAPQMVKRSDYARVLAEFWADGPDSETPPGHWFTLLNYVSDHPDTVKKLGGQGNVLSDLEWDVKCYLTLGGAMHDVAVDVWGIKGYYDYIRPISAIRYMATKGQSSDNTTPEGIASYHPHGLPLVPGYIEIIKTGDPLAGSGDENVGKIKILAWKGPDFISDPETDVAGVDWILGTHWWPYQRGTFVTPPFAGYLSGHSTFSRAAAEVMTLLTGDEFFPGGMGTFDVVQNDFLVFEEGPTQSFTLQWATYQDASDQTSLSRIWGGIHPPIDDIRGRIIGHKIGIETFNLALDYFNGTLSNNDSVVTNNEPLLYPVPFGNEFTVKTQNNESFNLKLYSLEGKLILEKNVNSNTATINTTQLSSGLYFAKISDKNNSTISTKKIVKN